ncbi:MAG: Vi polysaccharide biosynthesis UDP-N-acetylglucosamine C-6 dehydrogenase TviB [Gammaproteobacteria bacterium]|nr:Vi polysaccharide biosynthesis UDP-N-acetylglucosamine C-6 dehydrogenase TviB [Gammaproteobacteria bacterium]
MPALPQDIHIAVIGLGYVGLPLATEFGKKLKTVGFDISTSRVAELRRGQDHTLEVSPEELAEASHLDFTDSIEDLVAANVYIVTVPTPINQHKQPDLSPLVNASRTIGSVLRAGDVVIYESTVYPGATEEVCIPILESESGLKFNLDFSAGYSPERINPGDKEHRVSAITKVTSGSNPEAAEFVDSLYKQIITAGTHLASSIKVAEAAKVIENTQRDLNIALINELAIIFNRLDIDTKEVLEAAGTKWNFLKFQPGLVGGHCISVDPYYLTHKAQEIGYHPQVILSGRQINDSMGGYVAEQVVKMMTQRKIHVVDSNVLVLGFAFKENCPDLRNTRVIDIVSDLEQYHANVDIYDPWADPEAAQHEYGIKLIPELQNNHYDAIIIAVGHQQFSDMSIDAIRALGKPSHILYDIKSLLPREMVDRRL